MRGVFSAPASLLGSTALQESILIGAEIESVKRVERDYSVENIIPHFSFHIPLIFANL